jgi:hypothetical protein
MYWNLDKSINLENLAGRDCWTDLSIDMRIVLEWIWEKYDMRIRTYSSSGSRSVEVFMSMVMKI